MKHRTFSENNLGPEGVGLLCETLLHPEGPHATILRLDLAGATLHVHLIEFNEGLISRLGSNMQNEGAMRLCELLEHPDAAIRELTLESW